MKSKSTKAYIQFAAQLLAWGDQRTALKKPMKSAKAHREQQTLELLLEEARPLLTFDAEGLKALLKDELSGKLPYTPIVWLYGRMASGKTWLARELFKGRDPVTEHRADRHRADNRGIAIITQALSRPGCVVVEDYRQPFSKHESNEATDCLLRGAFDRGTIVPVDGSPVELRAKAVIVCSETLPTDAALRDRCALIECRREKSGHSFILRSLCSRLVRDGIQ